jgi:hypothetical protein
VAPWSPICSVTGQSFNVLQEGSNKMSIATTAEIGTFGTLASASRRVRMAQFLDAGAIGQFAERPWVHPRNTEPFFRTV